VGFDGTGARRLATDGFAGTFHPDGRSVVFTSSRGGPYNLWELPLSGGEPVQLTFGEGPDWAPDIAPDGKTILFDVDVTNAPIFPWDVAGARRGIPHVAGEPGARAVAPGGRGLVAGTRRDGRDHVVMVSTADGVERPLTEGLLPSFS